METKFVLLVYGDRHTLDTLQTHAEIIRERRKPYNITSVSRPEDKTRLLIRVEDDETQAEKFKDMIRYRFPSVMVMLARINKNTDVNGK